MFLGKPALEFDGNVGKLWYLQANPLMDSRLSSLAIWRPSQSPTQPAVTSASRMECCQLSYQRSIQGAVIICMLQPDVVLKF